MIFHQQRICNREFRNFWLQWQNVEHILFIIEKGEFDDFFDESYFDVTSGKRESILEETLNIASDIVLELENNGTHENKYAFNWWVSKYALTLHNILHRTNKSRSKIQVIRH